jgi:L-aspartate oxidase
VVVGSGAAGISAALTAAASGLRVVVVTKDLIGGATALAQGGLAAAIGPTDSAASHVSDTLVAGAGLCEPEVVAALAAGAPGAIDWLAALGARLETCDLRLEGGHSHRRIVHSGDDATGAEVHRVLLAALLRSGIEILDRTVALDLIVEDPAVENPAAENPAAENPAAGDAVDGGRAGTGTGRRAMDRTATASAAPVGTPASVPVSARQGTGDLLPDTDEFAGSTPACVAGHPRRARGRGPDSARRVTGLLAGVIGPDGRLALGFMQASAVVIAAGGLGQAFATTSNPAGATGDGIAIAARAGAVLRDLEFVQFHPTVLWVPGASGQCPLITEALRGAGAVLRDLDGTPLMAGHDPRGDLAPRDVVAARMAEVIGAGKAGHVWLDATGISADLLESGFPTVLAACRKHGIDPVTEFIPVAPGAHYSCGGILADLDGQTSVRGLYAVGEAASTGVQGANRLASNSVTEAIIAGRRAGQVIATSGVSHVIDRMGSARNDDTGNADRVISESASALNHKRSRDREQSLIAAMSGWAGVMQDSVIRGSSSTSASATRVGGRRGLASVMSRGAGVTPDRDISGNAGAPGNSDIEGGRRGLALAMSRGAGVLRDREGLTALARMVSAAGGAVVAGGVVATGSEQRAGSEEAACVPPGDLDLGLDLEAVEAANLRLVSGLIVAGALRRAESRGCHRRRDAAGTAERPWHTLMRRDGQDLVVTEEEL